MTRTGEMGKGLLFISPFLVGFTVLTIYPVCASLYYSFCDYDIISPAEFVGLGNYADLLADERFIRSLWNTLIFTVFAVPVTMLTALVLAFLLNMKLRGQALYRTIFFLPSIVPMVASSVLWLWLLNPRCSGRCWRGSTGRRARASVRRAGWWTPTTPRPP